MRIESISGIRCDDCGAVGQTWNIKSDDYPRTIDLCQKCAAELAKQLSAPVAGAVKFPFLEQRRGTIGGIPNFAIHLQPESEAGWFMWRTTPKEGDWVTTAFIDHHLLDAETLNPTVQAERIAALEAEVERLNDLNRRMAIKSRELREMTLDQKLCYLISNLCPMSSGEAVSNG